MGTWNRHRQVQSDLSAVHLEQMWHMPVRVWLPQPITAPLNGDVRAERYLLVWACFDIQVAQQFVAREVAQAPGKQGQYMVVARATYASAQMKMEMEGE